MRRFQMKINFLKKFAAAIISVTMLSMGMVANAAESDTTNNTVLEAYDDSEWSFPTFTGDPSTYDQYLGALMDVCFRNDSQAFVALGLGTAEDATLIYNTVIYDAGGDFDAFNTEFESLYGVKCPETLKNDLQLLMAQLLGSARYAVTGCELQADGTYQVTIIYEQLQIFKPLMEVYMASISDMAEAWFADYSSMPSEGDLMIQILNTYCNCMRVCLDNATYAEPAITTVSIQQQAGIYQPDMDDFGDLIYLLFDTNSLVELLN